MIYLVLLSEVQLQLLLAIMLARLGSDSSAGAARLNMGQLLGNVLSFHNRHCTATSEEARVVTVISQI